MRVPQWREHGGGFDRGVSEGVLVLVLVSWASCLHVLLLLSPQSAHTHKLNSKQISNIVSLYSASFRSCVRHIHRRSLACSGSVSVGARRRSNMDVRMLRVWLLP